MPHLQIITASTRPSRKGPAVAAWFLERARRHGGFDLEPVDLADVNLPLLDEPRHPRLREYEHDHTRKLSATIDRADAFVVVTPEYDHGPPASLINALQYLVNEWAYKPIGFVGYGGVSAGTRSVNTLKMTVTTLRMMPIPEAVTIPFFSRALDEDTGAFSPGEVQEKAATAMLDELSRWAAALRSLRFGG
jgi:NAD(P)H-dependent FMN reductase